MTSTPASRRRSRCLPCTRDVLSSLATATYAPGPTGSGTTFALAGAYVLAGEVRKLGDDIDAALVGYERVMGPLIEEVQKIPFGDSSHCCAADCLEHFGCGMSLFKLVT